MTKSPKPLPFPTMQHTQILSKIFKNKNPDADHPTIKDTLLNFSKNETILFKQPVPWVEESPVN